MSVCIITRSYNSRNLIEWIEYHLSIRVKHIFIYDDHSTVPIAKRVIGFKNVSTIRLKKRINNNGVFGNGEHAYQHLMRQVRKGGYKYVIDIDVDEYLYLGKYKNIQQLIKGFGRFDMILFPFLMFGTNGKKKIDDNSYIKNFTMCEDKFRQWTKSIAKVASVSSKKCPHAFNLKRGGVTKNSVNHVIKNGSQPIPKDKDLKLTIKNNTVIKCPPCIFHYNIGDVREWINDTMFRPRIRHSREVYLMKPDNHTLDQIFKIVTEDLPTKSKSINELKLKYKKNNQNKVYNKLIYEA